MQQTTLSERMLRRDRAIVVIGIVAIAALSWAYMFYLSWGMNSGTTMDMSADARADTTMNMDMGADDSMNMDMNAGTSDTMNMDMSAGASDTVAAEVISAS